MAPGKTCIGWWSSLGHLHLLPTNKQQLILYGFRSPLAKQSWNLNMSIDPSSELYDFTWRWVRSNQIVVALAHWREHDTCLLPGTLKRTCYVLLLFNILFSVFRGITILQFKMHFSSNFLQLCFALSSCLVVVNACFVKSTGSQRWMLENSLR